MKRILIAVDDETDLEVALGTGLKLGRDHDAQVRVVAVIQDLDRWSGVLEDILSTGELFERAAAHRQVEIRKVADVHEGGDNLDVEAIRGVAVVEIIRNAADWHADLILQASHSVAAERGRLSSADWQLVRKSPIPVWIVNGPCYPPRQVVAAVELGAAGHHSDGFNERIVELAASVAAPVDAALTVYSAWNLPGEAMLRDSPILRVSEDRLSSAMERTRVDAQRRQALLGEWLERRGLLAPEQFDLVLEHGQPRDSLPAFAKAANADLLVMGTLGRTGVPGLLIGNTAETVLSRVPCSVLTLKPSQFISPVR